MNIGERIKKRRISLGLSVDEVAKKIGKNRATIYRYESNEIEDLPTSVLEPLSEALHTTPAVLMGWEIQPKTILLKNDYTIDSSNELTNEEVALINRFRKACTDTKLQVFADLEIPVLGYPVGENRYRKLSNLQRITAQNFLFKNENNNKEIELLENYIKLNDNSETKLIEFLDFLLSKSENLIDDT